MKSFKVEYYLRNKILNYCWTLKNIGS